MLVAFSQKKCTIIFKYGLFTEQIRTWRMICFRQDIILEYIQEDYMKALVTGASSGIGRDIAVVLSNLGIDLFLTGRSEKRLKETADMLNPEVNAAYIIADLSDESQVKKLYNSLKNENISILVNNAGFGECGDFYRTSLEKDINMIKTNITALHILTKLFLRDFVKKNRGYILNVGSSASFLAGPEMASYYASKNYVYRLSEAIYEEMRQSKKDVHISVLCPGPVDTSFNKNAHVRFSMKGLSSMKVAKCAVNGMFEKQLVIVPGRFMKLVKLAERFVPEKLLLSITYRIQRRKIYR